MIFKSEMGRVNNNSMVPVLRSSAMDLIVMAGINTRKINGDRLKKGIISASCPSNKLVPISPEITQWKSPDAMR